MRLTKLELLAFGHFRGHVLDFASPGLHVVLGRNEAGKSTTLRAITGLLYGIEHKTQDAFSLSKPGDLRVGGTVESASGERLRFQRRKGLSSTLLDPSDKPIDEGVLRRFLGGVTRETFVHAYGLDHDTLAEGARALLEGKGDLGESLFDASVGGGGGVQQLVAELDAEADRLFKPKASNPLLNEAIKAFNDATKRIKETQSLPEAFAKQEAALTEEVTRRDAILAEKRELEVHRARLVRASKRAPRERERAHVLELQRALGAVVQRLAAVEALAARFAAYEHALDTRTTHRAELERLAERLAEAMRRASLASDPRALGPRERDAYARNDERVKPLLAKRTKLNASLELADKEIRRAELALARLIEPAGSDVPAPSVAPVAAVTAATRDALAAAVERARSLGTIDERLEAESARIDRQRTALAARATAAGSFAGGLEELVALRPPPLAVIQKLVARADDAARRATRLDDRESELDREVAGFERDAAKNEGDFAPPDAAALRTARAARDEAWSAVRAASPAARAEAELTFDRRLRECDAIADKMVAAADRVTTLARLRAELERCAKQRVKLATDRCELEAEQARIEEEGRELFARAGIGSCDLVGMPAWIAAHAQVSEEYTRMAADAAQLAVEKARRERAVAELRATLSRAAPARTEPAKAAHLADLLVEAAARLEEIDHARRLRENAERAAADRARAVAEQRAALEDREAARAKDREAVAEVRAKLAALIEPLGLGADASDDEVNRANHELREVFILAEKRADAEARLALAEAAIAEFEGDLRRVLAELASDVDAADARAAARELFERGRRARECAVKLANIDALLAEEGDPGPLAEDERAIVSDPDRAEAVQQELGERIDELDRDAHQAAERVGAYRLGLEDMRKESNAAEAAAAAQHHLARVREGAERWARVKLAAVILQREIERYREENQGPLLAASSKLFARLTLGRFAGIKAGFDDKDKPCLRCVRDDGKTEVDVAGLSDGTRDQLYLSLRLASLLRRGESTEPMPLILDDVLIQLDDQRAAAALGVLAEVSRTMQVLFFTHHARLVELAKDAVPARDLVVHSLVATPAASLDASP